MGCRLFWWGTRRSIRQEAAKYPGTESLPITYVHASEAVGMDESPLTPIRKKKGFFDQGGL